MPSEKKIEIDLVYMPVVNFALQQNHVPVLRKLVIKNTGEEALENLSVDIVTEPDFAITGSIKIENIATGESLDLSNISFKLSPKYLSEVTEKISGHFKLTVKAKEEELYKETHDISILAFDQWYGIQVLPEMLSAFITPNHPEVGKVLKRASSILEKWTGNPSFDEYQTQNPDRVKKQMAAIFEAIAEMKLVYCSVPASFEQGGQRIRMVDTIAIQQMANCLDLSLFYASCLEAAGIQSLIIIIKGHAFAGAWLVKDSFADSVNDDISLLTKRMADGINEITVVEATCMNAGQTSSFDDAVKAGQNHLLKEDDFLLFLDVKRSRFGGIRPLPLRISTSNGWEIVEVQNDQRNSDAPGEIVTGSKLLHVDSIEVSKQRLWERKLLDLSLRNNLLNLRITKTTIQLIPVRLNHLEDALASGAEFQLLSKPADWDNPLRNSGLYQSLNQSDPIIDLVQHEFSQKRLRTYQPENELSYSVVNLYRAAKLSLEENGANTLYIALGILKWFETNVSEKPRFAPILLIPIDIIKKSAQKGYVIRSREEETMMNITLLEMLRQDFGINIGGLENLPKDESGVDVKMVFNIIRQSIMSQTRWDVEEQAFISTFSFSKFIMWNDIHNNADKLVRNKIVASLIEGKMQWQAIETNDANDNLDAIIHPSSIALPISTDSSQLEAVHAAVNDNSFILHGPPGTGKSQTITNIIANALYNGKKVLFVAEKMAALQVVQKRLEGIGLGAFCLELHSNKSKKSAVLEQLKRVTELVRKTSPLSFAAEAERLHSLRTELNNYVDALHKVHHFGFSVYDAFAGYALYADCAGKISFSRDAIAALNPEKLTLWNDLVEELQTAGSLCSHPHNHALKEIRLKQYNQQTKTEGRELLSNFIDALGKLNEHTIQLCSVLKIDVELLTAEQYHCLKLISEILLNLPDTPSSFISADNLEQTMLRLQEVIVHGKRRDEVRSGLLQNYRKEILSYDAALHLSEWQIASTKWFLPKWLKQNAIKKELSKLSVIGKIEKDEIIPLLETIIAFQKEQEQIDRQSDFIFSLTAFLWKEGNPDWQILNEIADAIIKLNRQGLMLFSHPSKTKEWRNKLAAEFTEGSRHYILVNEQSIKGFTDAFQQVREKEQKLRDLLKIETNASIEPNANWIETSLSSSQRWLQNIEALREWCNWNFSKRKAVDAGLSPVVQAYEAGLLETGEVTKAYKKELYRSCAEFVFDKEQHLASFNGIMFEEKIKRFREISQNFEALTKEELFAKLASRIPSFTQEASQTSEISILQRAIRHNGRGISLRKLFDSIPHLLPRLHPCMLMSPISVAQYFDAAETKFDLVVFDEASQMPTCEAVGAMARGSNVVVVGDPKQMPPTSFFSSAQFDEDNVEKEDLESVLDDCLALSMPSKHLLWHYRSKHESLIAFSNSKYYDNKLMTFPSPDDIDNKVKLVHVDGFYDRGKTKHNKAEAKAIVDEVLRRLSHPQSSKQSIGVVTFSSVQQILIDDMLNEAWKTHPDLEAIATNSGEPLFIKNLENVQGDERDVILFSVGYGPDKDGKVSLNFGPINRNGGWRRLNVAVSRARYEMKVFSTLKADQIDIARTASEGVAGLKAFLEYAEKGKNVLNSFHKNKNAESTAFINILANEIRDRGYDVHINIGCSGYRIDIGIVDKENPSRYVLGILCDGPNYKSARTARDREIVQVEVLKLLGWKIHRIWSVEWWENPTKLMEDVVAAIGREEETKMDYHMSIDLPMEKIPMPEIVNEDFIFNSAPSIPAVENTLKTTTNGHAELYETCRLDTVLCMSSEEFFYPGNKQKICEQIKMVIEKESPVSKNLLCKRVLAAWGISRMGTRLNSQFELLFSQLKLKETRSTTNSFFWKDDENPLDYHKYRVHKSEQEKRNAEDLAPEEVANAVKEILSNQISLTKTELMQEAGHVFGFSRMGTNVEQAMLNGINKVIERGFAEIKEERVVVSEKVG